MNVRAAAERRGRRAETLTCLWLQLKAYRILARRARTAMGEIDIIAARGQVLAFVEVKALNANRPVSSAISAGQRLKLVRAAALWRSRHRRWSQLQPRFDLVLWPSGQCPRHLRAAWTLDDHRLESLL